MADNKPHEDSLVWMSGDYKAKDILLKRAIIREGLSKRNHDRISIQEQGG